MKQLEEKIVKSNDIYKGRLLEVKREDVVLADGTPTSREVVYHPGAVAMVPLKEDDTLVLVRQFRLPTGKALLEIPAGTLEAGEEPEACAQRELAEEVGFWAGRLTHLASIYLAPGYSSELIHLFAAEELQPNKREADGDERLEIVEVSLAQALEMIYKKELKDAKTVTGIILTARDRQRRLTARADGR